MCYVMLCFVMLCLCCVVFDVLLGAGPNNNWKTNEIVLFLGSIGLVRGPLLRHKIGFINRPP